MKPDIQDYAQLIASLPEQQPEEGLDGAIRAALHVRAEVVAVLDDDPTGTQTVYDVPVITEWSEEAIADEIERGSPLFYILTNTRSRSVRATREMMREIGENLRRVRQTSGKRILTVVRGDSTLRGHFPHEDLALLRGLGGTAATIFVIPAFFEGGRYTINDVHYVREGEQLIPAAQTPFARDEAFGYRNSNLREWIAEKAEVPVASVRSIGINELRSDDPRPLVRKLDRQEMAYCAVNAADYVDLKRALLAILRSDKDVAFRTAASFVAALLGQPPRPLLRVARVSGNGGLILVGSHVPKSTAQLHHLRSRTEITAYEIDVKALAGGSEVPPPARVAARISSTLEKGEDVLLFTSREVVRAPTGADKLSVARLVSDYCQTIIRELQTQPSFLLTKGGITSSDVATKALGVKRAVARGQVQPGVPTWELGPESKFPGMPFIIFPGNVGQEDSLTRFLQNVSS